MNQYDFYAHKPSEKYHKSDIWFLISVLLLWGLGMFTIFVCSQGYAARFFNNDSFYFVKRQLVCSVAGIILFMAFLLLDMETIKKLVIYMVLVTLLLCLLTFIKPLSIEKNGARRWIRLPLNFTFQPSELVKFVLVLYLASYFDKLSEDVSGEKDVLPCVGIFLSMVILVLFQKDFSTSVFLTCIGVLMFFVAGAKLKWLIPFLIIAIPVAIIVVTMEQYRIERIIGFLKPSEGIQSYNYQATASKATITAGGIWGAGIGKGLSKLNSIPEVQADYIFAGWTEAMGYFGVIAYLALLILFAWRGYKAAISCPERFAAYGCFGCVSVIVVQSVVNLMVVCGLLPSTGIPLPFFSVGGSSIIITLGMCGFILNASRCQDKNADYEKFEDISVDTLTVI
ncbi:MAG: FtsW/RodA/SpoVE family cell cycle protein [Treponema sp.]|nr:FtsW/RodA/SpoVE family cell cycle protein [Treponema sp.]